MAGRRLLYSFHDSAPARGGSEPLCREGWGRLRRFMWNFTPKKGEGEPPGMTMN